MANAVNLLRPIACGHARFELLFSKLLADCTPVESGRRSAVDDGSRRSYRFEPIRDSGAGPTGEVGS